MLIASNELFYCYVNLLGLNSMLIIFVCVVIGMYMWADTIHTTTLNLSAYYFYCEVATEKN